MDRIRKQRTNLTKALLYQKPYIICSIIFTPGIPVHDQLTEVHPQCNQPYARDFRPDPRKK